MHFGKKPRVSNQTNGAPGRRGMGGWMDGWVGGWVDGWMGGWVDDGWMMDGRWFWAAVMRGVHLHKGFRTSRRVQSICI